MSQQKQHTGHAHCSVAAQDLLGIRICGALLLLLLEERERGSIDIVGEICFWTACALHKVVDAQDGHYFGSDKMALRFFQTSRSDDSTFDNQVLHRARSEIFVLLLFRHSP